MANSQYNISVDSRQNKPILPRSLRRHEMGWDSTMFSTNLVALHVPNSGTAKWVHVPVVHFNIDEGKTMVMWRQYWEDRAETAYVTLPAGRKYLVVVPYNLASYQVSEHIEEKLGLRWNGEMLVFACGVNNNLLVNMRTWQEDRNRAWDVVRRYIVGDIDGNTEITESENASVYQYASSLSGEDDTDLPSPGGSYDHFTGNDHIYPGEALDEGDVGSTYSGAA